ncbi:replicative helicase loader/inhibitor [Peribacillus glennii]|uniref:Uncharacterized protein n=1 Tax=Peribacillus glennii TaxID=2303991 RepID=A0A372L781_9BACI|nr:replicative helicase loader/inhibitor [Peribacillus glennii]RFU61093.1 hypothetical protein D0466_19090 [Peribacillus glennii]
MTKHELFTILELITAYYDQFELDQKKIDAWHDVLRSCSFESVKARLTSFAAVSAFPPKVSDLVGAGAVGCCRAIPDVKETLVILETRHKPASKEVIKQELAHMREILGIREARM